MLSFSSALLLAPLSHIQTPLFKLGDIATTNIKADRDFLVEKREATEQKKLEIARETPLFYDYDSELIKGIMQNLSQTFIRERNNRISLQKDKNFFKLRKKAFEDSLGISVTSEEFETLYKNNFSPSIAERINGLLNIIYSDESLITNVTFLEQEKEKGIVIRNIHNQSESFFHNLSKIKHIKDVEAFVKKKVTIKNDIDKVVVSLTIKLLQPNLIFNKDYTEMKKQEAIKDVKPVFYKVKKNEMLVREGEKITSPILEKLEAYYRVKGEKKFSNYLVFLRLFLIIGLISYLVYYCVRTWLKINQISELLFLAVIIVLQLFIVRTGIFVASAVADAFHFLSEESLTYAIPFTTGAMLVAFLRKYQTAIFTSVVLSLFTTFLFEGKISLFLYSFAGSIVATTQMVHCLDRSSFFKSGIIVGFVNIILVFLLNLTSENFFSLNSLISLFMGLLGGGIAAIMVAGMAPIFESLFHYTTNIKLLELANLNQPIFQRMMLEAPGTYHHSVIVASMVEAAAEAISANALLAKVSAYYHDIGKLKKPQYFIENQQPGENKHDKLSPKMSSLIIISHVKEGCELAQKLNLGKDIINIIREHHGTSLVSFFYEKAKKDKDPSIRSLSETDFRYPGPKPQTKEAGLVLLGDVLEASSRALTNPTPARLKSLVHERIENIFLDGQLDECDLTLKDLNKIAESFSIILNGVFHHRISYPEPVIINGNGKKDEINGGIHKKSTEKGETEFASLEKVGK